MGSRDLNLDPICSLCKKNNEYVDHLLRGCEVAKYLWQELKSPHCLRDTFNLPLGKRLESNCQSDISSKFMGIPWRIFFPIGFWQLWLHINNFVFKIGKVEHLCFKRCIKDSAKYYSIGFNAKLQKAKVVIPIGWMKPPEGWVKLNSGGSVMRNPKKAGGGGMIRSPDGEWLTGYARPLGHTNSCMTELWALRDGLMLAKDKGLNNLIVELDAISMVLLYEKQY